MGLTQWPVFKRTPRCWVQYETGPKSEYTVRPACPSGTSATSFDVYVGTSSARDVAVWGGKSLIVFRAGLAVIGIVYGGCLTVYHWEGQRTHVSDTRSRDVS